ncbi:MAG: ABC transporter permease [Desulfobacterales bacterium]|nr:ABC transporter permease [Desulfobacteraceae bacterium]MBT4363680.1 ABC transporter permease [Desulfobacteraceae bacterium]MBT7696656.1 ABC transporter permease [Desulfobacterales bacterium]
MINWRGMYILFSKEVWRFLKVTIQTIITPVVTVLLYLLVFSSVLSEHVEVYKGVSYTAFLIPGLIMMSVLQNSFANNSSSIFQSKLNGNIVFMLLAPISDFEMYIAYTGAATLRGVLVGIGAWVISSLFVVLPVHSFFYLTAFAVIGSAILGSLGMISSICADKWDHIAAFQNFVIMPLSFLSGAFYSINILPDFWQKVSLFNPFFYMIDGFRYGFLGVSDISVIYSLSVVIFFFVVVSIICLWILKSGYKLRD